MAVSRSRLDVMVGILEKKNIDVVYLLGKNRNTSYVHFSINDECCCKSMMVPYWWTSDIDYMMYVAGNSDSSCICKKCWINLRIMADKYVLPSDTKNTTYPVLWTCRQIVRVVKPFVSRRSIIENPYESKKYIKIHDFPCGHSAFSRKIPLCHKHYEDWDDIIRLTGNKNPIILNIIHQYLGFNTPDYIKIKDIHPDDYNNI